jgi:hypothetical protein
MASVVAWLESIADDHVAQQGAQRFADHDGVWIESRHQIGKGVDVYSVQGKALQFVPQNMSVCHSLQNSAE